MQDIFRYIDDHLNESITGLTELCKLPTVSAQNTAIEETAEHVSGLLRDLAFEAQQLLVFRIRVFGSTEDEHLDLRELMYAVESFALSAVRATRRGLLKTPCR